MSRSSIRAIARQAKVKQAYATRQKAEADLWESVVQQAQHECRLVWGREYAWDWEEQNPGSVIKRVWIDGHLCYERKPEVTP